MGQPTDLAILARLMDQALATAQAMRADLRALIALAQRVQGTAAGLLAEMQAARP